SGQGFIESALEIRRQGVGGSPAEVGGLELRVVAEILARAVHGHAAGLEHVGVAADLEGEVGVLLDEQDGDALPPVDLDDLLEDRGDQPGCDAEGELVEYMEARAAREGAADREFLLLAV